MLPKQHNHMHSWIAYENPLSTYYFDSQGKDKLNLILHRTRINRLYLYTHLTDQTIFYYSMTGNIRDTFLYIEKFLHIGRG